MNNTIIIVFLRLLLWVQRISRKLVKNKIPCFEFLLDFHWISLGFHLNFSWISLEILLDFPWISLEFPWEFPWNSLGFLLEFSRISLGILMDFPWIYISKYLQSRVHPYSSKDPFLFFGSHSFSWFKFSKIQIFPALNFPSFTIA